MSRSTRFAAFAVYALLIPAVFTAAAAAEEKSAFPTPREKIEKPYTNDKCIKNCHGETTLRAGGRNGEKRDLHVDLDGFFESIHGTRGLWCIDCHFGADPNFHPREGYALVDCRACHSDKPPENVFPPNAASIFALRDIKPPPKEARKGDSWTTSVHGAAWSEGNRNAPFCSGCHTAHYVRPVEDRLSTVNPCNLPKTCGACHEGQVKSVDAGGMLARWSIAGHGKGDFSETYSESQCLSCHQGQAAHGEKTVTGKACPNCHRPAERIAAGEKGFHLIVGENADLTGLALRFGYNLIFWGALAAAAAAAFFWGVTSIYRKDERDGE